jgi:hypothetical protein
MPMAWRAFRERVIGAGLGHSPNEAVLSLYGAAPRQLVEAGVVPRCKHTCSVRIYCELVDRCTTTADREGLFQGRRLLLSVDASSDHTEITAVVDDLKPVADLVNAIGQHMSRPWEIFDAADAPTDNSA